MASVLLLVSCTAAETNNPPLASFLMEPAGGYAPLQVEFDGSPSADPDGTVSRWEWDFGDGAAGKGSSCAHVYSEDGTYSVELRIRDDRGAEATSSADVSVLNPPPVVEVDVSPRYGASPLAVSFDATESYDPSGEIVSVSWDFGDGTTGTGMQVAHTFAAESASTFAVVATAVDDDGAEAHAMVTVAVQKPGASNAPPVASFTVSPASGVAPLTVAVDAGGSYDSDGAVASFGWTFGDGGSASGETASHTFTKAGTFRIELTARDDDGATSAAGHDVTVDVVIPEPPAPPG